MPRRHRPGQPLNPFVSIKITRDAMRLLAIMSKATGFYQVELAEHAIVVLWTQLSGQTERLPIGTDLKVAFRSGWKRLQKEFNNQTEPEKEDFDKAERNTPAQLSVPQQLEHYNPDEDEFLAPKFRSTKKEEGDER